MEPLATVTTSGVITVNADQVMGNTLNVFTDFLQNGDNLKNLLIMLAVVIGFVLIKMWIRKMDDAKRRKNREAKEREKARIWKEEYK
ncbi:MAG: hypothetical protein WCP92_06015 [bacterium]